MPAADELYPPTQYSGSWLWLALGIIAVILVGAALLIFFTRPRTLEKREERSEAPAPSRFTVLWQLREEYLGRIADIESRFLAGAMTPRTANLELSRAVRSFVNEFSGLEAPVMTLDDLVKRGVHPSLVDAVSRHYYPSIFRSGPSIDPRAGAEAARKVVAQWN